MNTKLCLWILGLSLCLVMMTACASKSKRSPEPGESVAIEEPVTPVSPSDKDVISEDTSGTDVQPGDADFAALPADASAGPALHKGAAVPALGTMDTGTTYPGSTYPESKGYPDYTTPSGTHRSGGSVAAGGTYTVRRGDSLWSISRRHSTTVGALAEANGIGSNAVLREGQKLKMPGGGGSAAVSSDAGKSAGGRTYTVRSGDSYWTIARKFGVSVDKLKAANNATSDALREGQKLAIP